MANLSLNWILMQNDYALLQLKEIKLVQTNIYSVLEAKPNSKMINRLLSTIFLELKKKI